MTSKARHSIKRRVRLFVSLTEKEAEVFFAMLSMATNEPSDVDFAELVSIENKFTKARKPNGQAQR